MKRSRLTLSIKILMLSLILPLTSCTNNNSSGGVLSSSISESIFSVPVAPSTPTSQVISSSTFSSSSTKPVIHSENNFYSNPTYPLVGGVKTETYTADPFVIRGEDNDFYLYCTQTDVFVTDDKSSGRRFKRGPIFKSNDCVNWKYIGDVFENYEPKWGTSGAGVWAPTVYKIQGQYLFYYSLSTGGDSNPGIGVASSPTPYGPWTHYGKLFNSEEIGVINSIDPYVFIDDGKVYMVFGSYGGLITIIQLTDDGLGLYNGLEYQKENKHAIAGFEIYDMKNYEGSIIYKKDEYYYLFLSTGTCLSGENSTYHVVAGRSKSLFGPYTDNSGRSMLKPNAGEPVVVPSSSGAMGVGHNGLIEDDLGELWMIYHGYDVTPTSKNKNARVLFMDKILWDEENGFPYVDTHLASVNETLPGPYFNHLEGK